MPRVLFHQDTPSPSRGRGRGGGRGSVCLSDETRISVPNMRMNTWRSPVACPELIRVAFTMPAWVWRAFPKGKGNVVCMGAVVVGSWTNSSVFYQSGVPHSECLRRVSHDKPLEGQMGLVEGWLYPDEVARIEAWANGVGLQWHSAACLRTLCMMGLGVPEAHKGWIDSPEEGWEIEDSWSEALKVYSGIWPQDNYMVFQSLHVVWNSLREDFKDHVSRVECVLYNAVGSRMLERRGLTPIKQGIARTIALYANILQNARVKARKQVEAGIKYNRARRHAEVNDAGT